VPVQVHTQMPPVDWDNIQIVETLDDEGRLQVASEEQLFRF
jgi:hypothetical protein